MNGITKGRYVLDTNAVIFFIAGGNVVPAKLEKLFDKSELFISIIAEIELFAKPDLPPDEEAGLRTFLTNNVTVVDIDHGIKKMTIMLRRTTKIKLPDCIIAATAIVLNAVLLTNDDELLKFTYPGYRARNLCEAADDGEDKTTQENRFGTEM
jgi:predicted nucleic acid-binding protein